MSFIFNPSSGSGDLPIAVSSTASNLVEGDYELTATSAYTISLDTSAAAGSEWTFTCADRTVETFNVTINGGATSTFTNPAGAFAPVGETLVINRGGVLITIRKIDTSLNYRLTVTGVARSLAVSTNPLTVVTNLSVPSNTQVTSTNAVLSNVVANLSTASAVNTPSTNAINTRFARKIWCRATYSSDYTDISTQTMTGSTVFMKLDNPTVTFSNAADWGTTFLSGFTAPQFAIAVAGTYQIYTQWGAKSASTATNYTVRIGRYSSANVLQETIGYTNMQMPASLLQNQSGSCMGIGDFAVGEKIGLTAISAGGGTIQTNTFVITATAF
jgi:hypothetical protein